MRRPQTMSRPESVIPAKAAFSMSVRGEKKAIVAFVAMAGRLGR